MDFFAQGLAERGCRVVRYTYPYTASSRAAGQREAAGAGAEFAVGAPAQSVLISAWRTCWQQGRSAVDFLSHLLRGTPVALALPP
jgi:hypothetical protein